VNRRAASAAPATPVRCRSDDQEAEIARARLDQSSLQFGQAPHVLLRRQPPDVSDQERAVAAQAFGRENDEVSTPRRIS